MATLKEIAQEAGVSVMTVSRVINKRYGEVSEENIRKIQEIIDRLGYVPNYSARNLSSKSSNIISILIQGTESLLNSPYNASMLNYIIQGIQDRGFNTMVHFISDYSEVTQHLQSWRAQGAIFFGTFDKDMQKIQTSNPMPLIFTDSYSNMRQVINIGIDDYKGGVLAAKHFIEKGHTAFSFVSSYIEDSKVIQQRLNGFRDTLEQNGFSLPDCNIIDSCHMEECAERLCCLSVPATAVFLDSDMHAAELISALRKKSYCIPEDYSVIGFDNLPLSSFLTPQLTSVAQNIEQKAKYTLDILFRHLEDPSLPAENVILDVNLVVRDSVCDRRSSHT